MDGQNQNEKYCSNNSNLIDIFLSLVCDNYIYFKN